MRPCNQAAQSLRSNGPLSSGRDACYFYFSEYLVDHGKLSALYVICAIVVAAFLISNVFGFMASLTMSGIRIRLITNLRQRLYDTITRMDLGQFTDTRKGDLMARVTTDVQQLENTVVGVFHVFIKDPLFVAGYFTALLMISPELTLYTLAIIPISAGIISFLTRRMRKSARESQDALASITSQLDETIFGIRIIKSFTARSFFSARFLKELKRYGRHDWRIAFGRSLAHPTSEFLGAVFMSLILIKGGTMVFAGELTGSTFIGFLLVFSQLLNPAKAISNAVGQIPKGIAAGQRVFELSDRKHQISSAADAPKLSGFSKSFDFSDVSFSYEGEERVLNDISFHIAKGEVVALVGPSGAGKSTIADLLARFYDPTAGAISIDGHDLRQVDLDSLRSLMGIVTQESILFNDTIFNNIAFGDEGATLEKVERAARIANATEFIEKLPDGFETTIGERGTKLSGGQRQRITIARAIYKDPPVLILDEATSSLDSQSEQLVQEAIFHLMENRTSLVIAHRLSTIQKADRILVVDKGEIVEAGTHAELMKRDGLYRELTEIQSFA